MKNLSSKKKPIGITIIGILLILFGLFVLYDLTIVIRAINNGYHTNEITYVLIFLVTGILSLISSYLLLTLKKSGKILTVILSILMIIKVGYGWITGEVNGVIGNIIWILFFVLIIFYLLFSKNVKEVFR